MSAKNLHAQALGKLGGAATKGKTSPAKKIAARLNGARTHRCRICAGLAREHCAIEADHSSGCRLQHHPYTPPRRKQQEQADE